MKFWKITFTIIGLFPLSMVILSYVFYFHAVSLLGYYPAYGNPDPKELNIDFYYNSIGILLFTSFYLFWLFILLMTIFIIKKRNERSQFKVLIFPILAYILGIAYLTSDVFEWIID